MALVFLRVPRLHNLSIFGIPITDKFFAYLIAAQMAFTNMPSSLLSAAIGGVTGCIYHFDVVGLQKILPPVWLQKLAASLSIPKHQTVSISQAPLQSMPHNAPGSPRAEALIGPGAGGGGFGGFGGGGGFQPMGAQMGGGAHLRAGPRVQANPELVDSVMSITGMPRQQVEAALAATNNNADAATAQLMGLD